MPPYLQLAVPSNTQNVIHIDWMHSIMLCIVFIEYSPHPNSHWTTLQHTAPHCSILQHTATHFNTLQRTAAYRSTATHCNKEPIYSCMKCRCDTDCNKTLHHTAPHCTTLKHTAPHCNTLHHTAPHCNTLQHTATHCNTLQHTATHCNTLHHTATHCITWLRGALAHRREAMLTGKYSQKSAL